MQIFCALLLITGFCHGVSKASQCTSRGRFADNEAEDCRGYTICIVGRMTNFTQYKLQCPIGFVYSHFEQQCTNATGYKCFDSYNCSGIGNFPEPNSGDCRSFVACIEAVGDTATARLVDCPQDTSFDASKGECVNTTDYNCNQRTTNINVTESVNASVILYDFSTNTNTVYSRAHLSNQVMSVFWLFIIFLLE